MATEQLKIQIVLDDGSVKDAFINLEKQAKKTGDNLKNNTFDKITDSAEGLSDALSGNGAGLAARFAAMTGPIGAVVLAIGATATAFAKLGIEGEKANATNIQFTKAAEGAGLAADQLSEALIKQTEGLIDDEDALQTATKAIIALGSEASKLPEILQLSRGLSRSLGKDFKATFDSLSQFIETGNARALRQYGIILDLDAAYTKAAKSVGLLSSELTEQQKQAIRAELTLTELSSKIDATARSVTPLADAFQRAKVSILNNVEEISKSVGNFLARAFIDNADQSNVATERISARVKELNQEVSSLEKSLKTLNEERMGAKGASELARYALGIDEVRKSLKSSKEELSLLMVEMSGRSDEALFRGLDAAPRATSALTLTPEQKKKLYDDAKARESDLTKFLTAQEIARRNAGLETVNAKDIAAQQITSSQLRLNQQLEVLELQHKTSLADIENQFSSTKKFSNEQREQAILAATATYNAQRLALEQTTSDQMKQISESSLAATKSAMDAQASLVKSGLVSAISSIGASLQAGKGMFDDFGAGVTGIVGDLAINIGQTLLFTGSAIEAFITAINGLFPGSGFAAAAAGLGLIIFGGALKASVGKSGGAPSSSGGGIASSPSSSTDMTPTQELERMEPQTAVSVVINGDVLDSDESGSRIVSLINQAFDKKGVVINQGVMA